MSTDLHPSWRPAVVQPARRGDPMTRTPHPPDRPATPDDAELGSLVRSVADDWHMPPQRLDQPTWRDRVGGGNARRRRRGLVPRLALPITTAIAATVIVAFVAVWLSGAVEPDTGKIRPSAAPVTSSAPSASPNGATVPAPPAASALPQLYLAGAAPDPARLLVRNGASTAVVDLTNGGLTSTGLASHTGQMAVLPDGTGGWLCVCSDWRMSGDFPTGADIELERARQDGTSRRTTVRSLDGTRDPGVGGASQHDLADVWTSVAPDRRSAFVGWTVHQAATGWSAGLDVVDVDSGVVDRVPIPMRSVSAASSVGVTFGPPLVAASPSGRTLLISLHWYGQQSQGSGTYRWTATFDGRSIGSPTPSGQTTDDRCPELSSGMIDDALFYLICGTGSGGFEFDRLDRDGTQVGRTDVSAADAHLDGLTQVARAGDRLFLWQPSAGRLSRIDLVTGAVAQRSTASVSGADPLAGIAGAIGRWLVPSALAKVFVEPGIVVSPDGRTIYALGIRSVNGEDNDGSLGVFVFDADSLAQTNHWAPTADFVSLAIGKDGRFVYAVGQAGADAAGKPVTDQQASMTAFDTADGSVRAIAGRLGMGFVVFPEPIVR